MWPAAESRAPRVGEAHTRNIAAAVHKAIKMGKKEKILTSAIEGW